MEPLIAIVVITLLLALVYWGVSTFISGTPLRIVGLLFALIVVLYTLRAFGLLAGIRI